MLEDRSSILISSSNIVQPLHKCERTVGGTGLGVPPRWMEIMFQERVGRYVTRVTWEGYECHEGGMKNPALSKSGGGGRGTQVETSIENEIEGEVSLRR